MAPQADLVAELAARLVERDHDAPVRVAIDGRSAAGKTHLATALTARIADLGRAVLQVSIDDFHTPGHKDRSGREEYTAESYYEDAFDYLRFREWVLEPLGPGGDRVVRPRYWRSFDDAAALTTPISLRDDVILVAEGAFLMRPELEDCWDVTIWVHVDFDTMIRRAVERDVAWVGDPEVVRRRYERRYVAVHRLYEERTRAPERADIVIDGYDWERRQRR